MRRFLTAFICLSTLAMAQNVIAAAPSSPSDGLEAVECPLPTTAPGVGLDAVLIASPVAPDRDLPEPGTMMLLVAGLSGLTAVGARGEGRVAPESN